MGDTPGQQQALEDRICELEQGRDEQATRADMAVALHNLHKEVAERTRAEENLRKMQDVLEQRVKDRRLIQLIRRMLKAKVVMPDGVVVSTEEGTPQGGPLSPLLSNIVLDELDWELDRRGHHFVRYADDCVPRRHGKEAAMVT